MHAARADATTAIEANFDGIVGPTHNYAGLSFGNIASERHRDDVANPRAAALQGLAKMRALHDLGLPQGVLPPHERPHVEMLRRLGFSGSDHEVIARASRDAPTLLRQMCSAAAMWTANAATVAPSADTDDGRVHLTPANLSAKLHRSIEPPTTAAALRAVFSDPQRFVVHDPLPGADALGDEGAANHVRLCRELGEPGLQLFVYGRSAQATDGSGPRRYPARQTREASEAVARMHRLAPSRTLFVRQSAIAIDSGVFHNDVISVGHRHVLLAHEDAFDDPDAVLAACARSVGETFRAVVVGRSEVSLEAAVRSYLFNSQLVDHPTGKMLLIAPSECEALPDVRRLLEGWVADGDPIAEVRYVDLRESMKNGGGPACLRLRVVLTDAERAAVNPAVWLDATLHARLVRWVERHYRDRLSSEDLEDPQLLDEGRAALDELTNLLGLGSIYPFQRVP